MRSNLITISILLILGVVIFACENKSAPNNKPTINDTIVLSPEKLITVVAAGGEAKLTVKASSKWSAIIYVEDPLLNQTPDWLTLSDPIESETGEAVDFKIQCEPNSGFGKRVATIAFKLRKKPNKQYFITVEQAGADTGSELNAYIKPVITVSNEYPNIEGEKVSFYSQRHGLWFFGWGQNNDQIFTIDFPSSTDEFNRVIMTYRMGAGPQGCSAYDHLTTMAIKYNDQWWEISRVVTPFGNSFDSSFEKLYYFDVTEYLPMLQGATEFKLYFNGFDGSATGRHHTAQISFDMYKGARDKNQIFAQKLYDSDKNQNSGYRSFLYGLAGEDIEADERMGPRTITLPAGVKSLKMKVVISGHGHDPGKFLDRPSYSTHNAAEFDKNFYTIKLNNVPCQQRGMIFIPCGSNYAQAGTAFFDRGNWCPGNPVRIEMWEFINISQGGGSFELDIDFERFQSAFSSKTDQSATYGVAIDIFGFDK